ncbi:hypothetical protein SAMN05445504_8027 [Burkholderia sp. CF099]|nr:hypothetical protein SAMN05445504_8027 [Burkholderia sp. CF099]
MSTVEVLAPLRLETRFVPPEQRTDGVAQWMLRLRVYPDDFSVPRIVAPPATDELDRLAEAIGRMAGPAPLSEADAFGLFAGFVGAGRALALWRQHVITDSEGQLALDRTGETGHTSFRVYGAVGLPEEIDVWFVHADGTRQLAATLTPDRAAIAEDMDLAQFTAGGLASGTLPDTWWLSYPRAVKVGLGIDIDVGAVPPVLDALVVLGIGETDAAELVDAHNASARMAVLAPGTPTNTVAGEPTTDFGEHAETVYPLLHAKAADQMSTESVLSGLTGRLAPAALPMLGGELDYYGPGSLAVQGFWPALWGRYLRDVTGAGETEIELARWAIRYLAVEGPRPAFRVGEQPYGLLPTSAFANWIDEPGDALAAIESRIRSWALPWRRATASANRAARVQVNGQDSRGLLSVLGLHAPSRYWGVRATADLYQLQALRLSHGMPPLDHQWDDAAADALRGVPSPLHPVGRAPGRGAIPGPPRDEQEKIELLKRLPTMDPELLMGLRAELGLVGHLMRETLIAGRAIVGDAFRRLQQGIPISLGQPLAWDDQAAYRDALFAGSDGAVQTLRTANDPTGRVLAQRFADVQEALGVIADLWDRMARPLFRAALAALDTAAFRVDPWLTGLAERRLQRLISARAPFRLGVYGWVDAPAPFDAAPDGPLAPGPTVAGLLHAPSPAQAMTAALLRDAAVRHPGIDRWRLNLDSAKVRAAAALAERVRLGVHPYEALGLEVERIAGDWDVVRTLRETYPLAADQQQRRVCDGQKVLAAARDGTLAAGLPADLAARLAPLDEVLDTYADLLVADGVHALVTGHADLANAAMEAAAGLGAPPELRAIRTPREATTVRVSAWVLLPAAATPIGPDADPAAVADPTWDAALAPILGGTDEGASSASLTGGAYEGLPNTADTDLRAAIAADLGARLVQLVALVQSAHDALAALDPAAAGASQAVTDAAARWNIDLGATLPTSSADAGPGTAERRDAIVAALADRLQTAASQPPADVRRALRTLAGRPELPVIPIVPRAVLPVLRLRPGLDREWLEIVAAVRPRLAALEARQLDVAQPAWPNAIAAPGGSTDPWHATGPVVLAYGPGLSSFGSKVALAAIDGWSESVPSRRHTTTAAFGFNAPKSRAPQAVLVAVPPDLTQRLDNAGLLDVVLETREMAHARVPAQNSAGSLPHAMSTALVSARSPLSFLANWPA